MLAMLDHLVSTGSNRPVIAVHAGRSPADHAHRAERLALVRALPNARQHLWYEVPGDQAPEAADGQADVSSLELPADLTAYLCGRCRSCGRCVATCCGAACPPRGSTTRSTGPDLWLGQ
jgi:nitric oxide dioxygenase